MNYFQVENFVIKENNNIEANNHRKNNMNQ